MHYVSSMRTSSSVRQITLAVISLSLIKVRIILRFLMCIPLKWMSFILKRFHCHIYFFTSIAPPPRDFLNANLNLTFNAIYFIW